MATTGDSTSWPQSWRATAASTTKRSAPPMPKSGWTNLRKTKSFEKMPPFLNGASKNGQGQLAFYQLIPLHVFCAIWCHLMPSDTPHAMRILLPTPQSPPSGCHPQKRDQTTRNVEHLVGEGGASQGSAGGERALHSWVSAPSSQIMFGFDVIFWYFLIFSRDVFDIEANFQGRPEPKHQICQGARTPGPPARRSRSRPLPPPSSTPWPNFNGLMCPSNPWSKSLGCA